MEWLLFGLATVVFFSFYNFLVKVAAGKIHPALGALVTNLAAIVSISCFVLYFKMKGLPIDFTKQGIVIAIAAGLFVGVGATLYFITFSKGAPAHIAIPLVIVGGAVLATAHPSCRSPV